MPSVRATASPQVFLRVCEIEPIIAVFLQDPLIFPIVLSSYIKQPQRHNYGPASSHFEDLYLHGQA